MAWVIPKEFLCNKHQESSTIII